jgi:hypothetical protein
VAVPVVGGERRPQANEYSPGYIEGAPSDLEMLPLELLKGAVVNLRDLSYRGCCLNPVGVSHLSEWREP